MSTEPAQGSADDRPHLRAGSEQKLSRFRRGIRIAERRTLPQRIRDNERPHNDTTDDPRPRARRSGARAPPKYKASLRRHLAPRACGFAAKMAGTNAVAPTSARALPARRSHPARHRPYPSCAPLGGREAVLAIAIQLVLTERTQMTILDHLDRSISEHSDTGAAVVSPDNQDHAISLRLRAVGSSFFWAMELLPYRRREAPLRPAM